MSLEVSRSPEVSEGVSNVSKNKTVSITAFKELIVLMLSCGRMLAIALNVRV